MRNDTPVLLSRQLAVPYQNRLHTARFEGFLDSTINRKFRSVQNQSIVTWHGRGRGVAGESVNSGSNPAYVQSRRRTNYIR
jgi:hypothetical protein